MLLPSTQQGSKLASGLNGRKLVGLKGGGGRLALGAALVGCIYLASERDQAIGEVLDDLLDLFGELRIVKGGHSDPQLGDDP